MPNRQSPVEYVLFSHYSVAQASDLANFTTAIQRNPEKEGTARLAVADHLRSYVRGLGELLNTPGYEGVLTLFYAAGFGDFLEGLGQRREPATMLQQSIPLRFSEHVASTLRRVLRTADLADRVRIITPLDLYPLLGHTHTDFAELFKEFITGSANGLRYDATKLVEAIIRLRLIGTGIPVFRADQDVIFRDDNRDETGAGDLGLFKALACCVEAYKLRLEQPSVATFLFSASYDSRVAGRDPAGFDAWSRAFATRIHPAVVADPRELLQVHETPARDQAAGWNAYLKTHTHDALALGFYGLKRSGGSLEADGPHGLSGIGLLGAPPLHAVISGALLSLSDGAILDLPPFSNFRQNVVWIDDHLKYSLHRAMNHFTSHERLGGTAALTSAQLNNVIVTKARPSTSDLPSYVLNTYLPALLWGTVMDAWITDDPILKRRKAMLDRDGKERWQVARKRQPAGVLPQALSSALRKGSPLSPADVSALKEKLYDRALVRINEVRREWGRLRFDSAPTFASAWARGEVVESFGPLFDQPAEEALWGGISLGRKGELDVSRYQLSPALREGLGHLVDDAAMYITWTVRWPQFVQIVRSAEQGAFAGDLSWRQARTRGA